MPTDLYLSQVLDVSLFTHNALNIIVAPCGCGKTVCAIERIATWLSHQRARYILSTLPKVARDWQRMSIFSSRFPHEKSDKIVVTPYAQFGAWESKRPKSFHIQSNHQE